MRTWTLTAYLVTLVATIAVAALQALFHPDPRKAARAYLIFKVAVGAAALRLVELPHWLQ